MTAQEDKNTEWLHEAHRRFGDREDVFAYVRTPFALWANLRGVFAAAYTYPFNEADIRSIYEYAEWSCRQPRTDSAADDLLTVVAVGFYEHIPEIQAAIRDLPRWFTRDEVLTMRKILSYQVGAEGFEQLLQAFPKSQRIKIKRKG